MPTSNPAFSNSSMMRAAEEFEPGWAAAQKGGVVTTPASPVVDATDRMTLGGVLTATLVMLALLLVAAAFGWHQVDQTSSVDPVTGNTVDTTAVPGWMWIAWLGAFGLALVSIFVPKLVRITGPLYALAVGLGLGAISAVYNIWSNGIVLQAVLCTAGVFLGMLFLYGTRIIRVTNKLRIGIIAATFGVFLTYLVTAIWWAITDTQPLIYDTGPLGIGLSILFVGVAAFNLLLDFDFIERGVNARLPKQMEWYAAFGLVVTLVWLYLEMLRLLAKLRQ